MDLIGCRDRVHERLRRIATTAAVLGFKKWGILIGLSIIMGVAVVVFRNFLFGSDWPAGGDVLGSISRAYLYGKDFRWLYLWHNQAFGFVEGIDSMDFLLVLIHSLFADAPTTTKIFMFSSFLVAGFSMYAFAYNYTHQHVAALSASLIYMLNQWIFSQFTEGHVRIVFSYALAPLLFLTLDRALRKRRAKDILLLSLGLALFITAFHPESIVIYGLFLAVFVIIYVLTPSEADSWHTRFKRLLQISLPAIIMCFFVSAFSLIPFFLNVRAPYYSPAYSYPLEDSFDCSYVDLFDAFTLKAVENRSYSLVVDVPPGLSLPDFPVSSLLLFLFSLAYCTLFVRRDRHTVFFAVSALISIFISKGPHPPFGNIFVWAWFNIPHFAVFRGANRWVMMAALSHAFLVSVLVSFLVEYVKKKEHLRVGELFVRVRTRPSESARVKEAYVSLDMLNRFMKKLHTFLYYSSVLLLILIFMSGFLSCWFFFSRGLQVYTPLQSYLEPYEWVAEQPGDYKVVTVGQSSDFASEGMVTDVGWGHDIGWESSFIHDKPTLQDGGWQPLSRDFVNYLRFRVVPENITDDLLRVLGTLNYKYIVLPPYASGSVRDFFLNQPGGYVVYNQSSIILENAFYTPHIFATNNHVIAVGGLESLFSLSDVDGFNLNETALVFAHQMDTDALSHPLFDSSEAVVFVNTDVLDLVMLSLKDSVGLINAGDYGVPSLNDTKYWIRSPFWRVTDGYSLSGKMLMTSGENNVRMPFRVDSDGTYDVWIRLEFGPLTGKLSVFIDGLLKEEIEPRLRFGSTLMWVNATRVDLSGGGHVITLENDGTGYNNIDAISVVEESLFRSKTSEVLGALQGFHGRIIYVLEAESAFARDLANGWFLDNPYYGFVLRTDGTGPNVSPEGHLSASSVYGFGFEADQAADGDLQTRWASSHNLPQWLQVHWNVSRELMGVRVVFEHAYAVDYKIQTWSGTDWVDQVDVKGNTLLERFHTFRQPVQTTKLRIYVTSVADFNWVSIWELEAYTTDGVSASTKVTTPYEGHFMLAARLAKGPDYGVLNIKISNVTFAISCLASNYAFDWYELGPFSLVEGDQTLTISANGKVDLDKIILFSLKDREEPLPLSVLLKHNSATRSVSYVKVNPCRYKISVKRGEPFLLIFSEAYHPLWRAYIDNVEVSPISAYSFVNGFFVNEKEEFGITLFFTGQTYADIGLRISVIALVGVTALAIIVPARSRIAKRLRKFHTTSKH